MPPKFMPHIQETLLRNLPLHSALSLRDYHPVSSLFPEKFKLSSYAVMAVLQHHISNTISGADSVWTEPFSVALTNGISIDFFYCRY
jgi:hypothetical protein